MSKKPSNTATDVFIPLKKKINQRERRIAALAVAPAVLLVFFFTIIPVFIAFVISFFKTNGLTYTWRGLDNYFRFVDDPVVHQALSNTIRFLFSVPLIISFALLVAVLLFEKIRGWQYFRVIFFIPNVLSVAVVGIMVKSIFGYYGPVNKIIEYFGNEPIQFFVDGSKAFWIIVFALVWAGFGYQALLLLAGLTSINPEILEAAALDGAGWWRRLWQVTIPSIRRILGFVFIINVLYTFGGIFGFIFVMTAGGPGFDTTTIDYLVYLRAFSSSNLGSGAALAVMLFLVIGAITLLQTKFFRISEDD
jgi:ABC-type sugar transport system permease subunit